MAAAEFARPHVARLDELLAATTELHLEATIAAGRPHEAIASLEELLVVDPLRERLWWQLMVAQYRCGRQADALRAYQRARAELAGQLGVDPGAELRELEVAILNQRPELDDLPGALKESAHRQWLGPPKTAASARTSTLPAFLAVQLQHHLETHNHTPAFPNADGGFLWRRSWLTRIFNPPSTATAIRPTRRCLPSRSDQA